MREYEFRGYNAKNKHWIYGFYLQNRGAHFVCPDEFAIGKTWEDYEVDPETVGQYTGLKDKNGRKVYEGDLLRFPSTNNYEAVNYVLFEVFWHDNDCASNHIGWQMNRLHFQGAMCGIDAGMITFLPKYVNKMEVIGNVHDNPELLKKT